MRVRRRSSRFVRWLALALAVCVGSAALGGPAAAAEDLVQFASAAARLGFDAPALSDRDLGEERGAGLDDEGNLSLESGDDFAVILWDEWKRNGNSEAGAISYDRGVGNSLSSTITGQMN